MLFAEKGKYNVQLSNFKSHDEFMKVADTLNNVVDTQRYFEITDIANSELVYKSLTDVNNTLHTMLFERVYTYTPKQTVNLATNRTDVHVGDVFIKLKVGDLGRNNLVIAMQNDPTATFSDTYETGNALKAKFTAYVDAVKSGYNYLSLENITAFNENDDYDFNMFQVFGDLDIQQLRDPYHAVRGFHMANWGSLDDPAFNCAYDFDNDTITFVINSNDVEALDTAAGPVHDIDDLGATFLRPNLLNALRKLADKTETHFNVTINETWEDIE